MNINKIAKFATAFLAATLLCSCAHEKVEYVDFSQYLGSSDDSVFQPTKVSFDDLNSESPSFPLPFDDGTTDPEEILLAGTSPDGETKATYTNFISIFRELLGSGYANKLTSVTGTYMSIDENGEPVRLSGKVVLPTGQKVRNVVVVSHFTVGSNAECPSGCFQLEAILATLGYAMIFPDYLGFGVSSDHVHPYLVADLTARNVVDMVRAVKPWMEQPGNAPESDEIFLMGYSQGGAVTMAVQRYMEMKCEGEFKIRRVFAGAGPYDIAATYDALIEADKTAIPYCVPMIIQGIDVGCHLGLDYADFFTGSMLQNYDEWLNSKKYTLKQISVMVGSNKLSDIMTEDGCKKRSPGTERLYEAMLQNSLSSNWAPEAPVYMFHSQDDDTVPFLNSMKAKNLFTYSNVEYNFGHYGNHQMGAVRFIFTVKTLFEEDQKSDN